MLEAAFGPMTPCDESLGAGPGHYFTIPGFRGKIGFISAMTHQFCDGCNRVRLTATGFLKTCLQYETGRDLRTLLRDGSGDEVLLEAIRSAILHKPAQHHFLDATGRREDERHNMHQIGGCPPLSPYFYIFDYEVYFMSKVIAVCTSEQKGTQKQAVDVIHLKEEWGIEGDAHAGKWHRQVSLLSHDKIEAFRARGAEVENGAFGENIIVEGIDFATLPIGTKFYCNDVVLQLTRKWASASCPSRVCLPGYSTAATSAPGTISVWSSPSGWPSSR